MWSWLWYSSSIAQGTAQHDLASHNSALTLPLLHHPGASVPKPHSSKTKYDVQTEPGGESDPRVILLFDLNGTLTCHTSIRRAQGITRLRPGVENLIRLKDRFRCGCRMPYQMVDVEEQC